MAHLADIAKYPKTFGHQLPEYFSIAEFEATDYNVDNTIEDEVIYENARQFMLQILDPLRFAWTEYCIDNNLGSGAIEITSGYRSEELNKLVNGSKTSVHCIGFAADIKPKNKKMHAFQEFVPKWFTDNNIEFDQIIKEKPRNDIASWMHIGWKSRKGEQRKQIFTKV